MTPTTEPVFCFTSDVDWASEACVVDLLEALAARGVRPTVFATHASPALEAARAAGALELGIHPNFLPGSSHGATPDEVVAGALRFAPGARAYRAHGFVDGSGVTRALFAAGLRVGSNACLAYEEGLVPRRHFSGIVQYPVFWEDDVHATIAPGRWDAAQLLPLFLTPGLKILNAHPAWFALNLPSTEAYARVRSRASALTASDVVAERHPGSGTRTFVLGLVDALLARGHRFHTLEALDAALPPRRLPAALEGG